MPVITEIFLTSSGARSTHDECYVVRWNPHTRAGVLDLDSTADRSKAKRWASALKCLAEWRTVSTVEPTRPWDGKPNRPLTAVNISIIQVDE